MKTNNRIIQFLLIISITIQIGCSKELEQKITPITKTNSKINTGRFHIVNPYGIENIKNSLIALGRNENLDENRIYYYYKFNPLRITGDILSQLELDSTLKIMDIPFARRAPSRAR
jgi:hypothetical protein